MRARRPSGSVEAVGGNPLETLALAALALVGILAVALWATGELAGRLSSGAWPRVGAGEMGGVLVRLASDAGNPAAAWPTGSRELLPSPVGFYAVFAVVVAPLLTTVALVVYRRGAKRANGRAASAEWAQRRDLRDLDVAGPAPGRLVLGRVNGRLVAGEARQSAIVIGPTQTGKTTGFAIPAILEWDGPVLATSVKTDLLGDTLAQRSAVGDVWVYDPTGGTGIRGAGWTPLASCGTWQGSLTMAAWLVASAQQGQSGLEDGAFWYSAAAKVLAPVLFAAATSEQTMADVVRWIDTQEEAEVLAMLDLADVPAALDSFQATLDRDPKTRSGVYTTVETVLAAYADPGVLASARPDISADRLLDGGRHTLYICAPAHEQQRLRPLLATLVQQIVAAVYERATREGAPLDPPLLLVLDECANIAPLRDLATLASTGAGQGIQLVTVFQDMAQVSAAYGRDRAPTIVSNHRAKVILTGISDSTTLDYVGRLLGDEQVTLTSATSSGEGSRSTTESMAFRSLAPANVLRQMRPGSGKLVYGHLPPARLTLRPWFRERNLRRLVAASALRDEMNPPVHPDDMPTPAVDEPALAAVEDEE